MYCTASVQFYSFYWLDSILPLIYCFLRAPTVPAGEGGTQEPMKQGAFPHSAHQLSRSDMSDSLWSRGLQNARLPCPSSTPGACSNSCPSSRWCHPTISSSVVPFSSCLQSFPASGSFPVSQLFTSGGQSIGSFSFSINPSNEYSGLMSFKIDWFDLLAVQGTLKRAFSSTTFQKCS